MTTPTRPVPAHDTPHFPPTMTPAGSPPTAAPDDAARIAQAAIAAAASHDAAALARTLHDVPDTRTAEQISQVLAAVIGTVLLHVHGRLPDDEQITAVAEEIASTQAWAGVTPPVIGRLLHGVVRAHPLNDVVSPGEEHLLFVCAAHLLSAHQEVVQAGRHPDPVAAVAPRLVTVGAAS